MLTKGLHKYTSAAVAAFLTISSILTVSTVAQSNDVAKFLAETTRKGLAEDGVDADKFNQLGLEKLSPEELNKLYQWHSNSVFWRQTEMLPQCPSFYGAPERPIRVKFLIDASRANSGTDAVIMSNFLDRFRSVSDVEISSQLASAGRDSGDLSKSDLVVSILAMDSKMGEREVGYVSSVELLTPCNYPQIVGGPPTMMLGTEVLFKLSGGFLQTSPSIRDLTETVYAQLNTGVLQKLRDEKRKARDSQKARQLKQ